jgi:hypothetical protein
MMSIFERVTRRFDAAPEEMALTRRQTMRVMMFSKTARNNGDGSPCTAWKTTTMKSMRKLAARLICAAPALFALTSAAANSAGSYLRMAPIDAYLMDRAEEIALAKSAAPNSISKDASILVLTRTGYETAVAGTNGFVCMVGRGFSGAPDWPERWNPKIRAAECLNPPAARSVAPIAKLRTGMTLAGRTDAEIIDRIKAALRTNEIPPLEPGAMSYMMSKSSYLTDEGNHDMAHVMFFVPFKDGAKWGANAPGSPVFGGNYWFFTPGQEAETAPPPLSVLLIGVASWSDGTSALMHKM